MARVMVELIYWFFFIVVLEDSGVTLQPAECDRSRRGAPRAGVLGSVRSFPWVGVLRVHLHHETSLKIALTGIVLVKERYAIGNADDIARIPKRVFQEDSKAMFIPSERAPWFCRAVDFMTHPEYELETLNTIALIELEPPQDTKFPFKPICWPPYSYNTSNDLYAVGYTDENQLLEKFIHKLQHVEQDLCKEFYSRAGLTEGMMAPLHYECGFAYDNKESCVWDNGMALVSNSSGHWVLLGLGLQGPGCAAPARFISLSDYYQWIESATDLQEIEDQGNYRKSAFNEGFKKSENVVEYIPAHELLRSNSSGVDARKQGADHQKHDFAHYYPFDIHTEDPFRITRVSGTEIQINLSKHLPYRMGSYGNCSDKNIRLIYKDFIDVNATSGSNISPNKNSIVRYLMSLHDSMFLNYTCVTIKLSVRTASPAYLYYDKTITDDNMLPENPDEIIRIYPFYTQSKLVKKGKYDHLKPSPIKSDGKNITAYHINLYLRAVFVRDCRLDIRFFGPPAPVDIVSITKGTTTTTTTTKPSSTTDPYADLRKNIPLEFVENEPENSDFSFEEPVYNNARFANDFRVLFWVAVIFNVL